MRVGTPRCESTIFSTAHASGSTCTEVVLTERGRPGRAADPIEAPAGAGGGKYNRIAPAL